MDQRFLTFLNSKALPPDYVLMKKIAMAVILILFLKVKISVTLLQKVAIYFST